jgi:hypothetical protein
MDLRRESEGWRKEISVLLILYGYGYRYRLAAVFCHYGIRWPANASMCSLIETLRVQTSLIEEFL